MAIDVSAVTSHFPTANKGFITTTSSTFSSGVAQTTVPLTSVSGLTNGTVFVGILGPGTASEREFTGTVDTAGAQITGVKWTNGSDGSHTAGTTIVDYVSATGQNMQTKGHLVAHDQDGTLKADAVDVTAVIKDAIITRPKLAAGFASEFTTGWIDGALPAVSTVTALGNRSYYVEFASTVASTLSPGMRLKTTRTVAAPTQCTSLNGSSQYYSKTSPNKLTFTNNFVISAWIKLSSYAAGGIVSRTDGTNGWQVFVDGSGRITVTAFNGGVGNYKSVTTYQSVPLNKWVHIATQTDMTSLTISSTVNYMMIDGVNVPASIVQSGTNPTSLVQAGSLNVGAINGANFFPGKIAQVAIYNAKVTQATILVSMNQGLSGSETSLASAYSFNNAITDLNTTTPNDLTAQGSAVATNADSPFGDGGISSTLDYALVMAVSTTTATVQVPEGCTLPTTGGITSVSYSTQANPYGWVSDKGRWGIKSINKTAAAITSNATYGAFLSGGFQLVVPVGGWTVGYLLNGIFSNTTTVVNYGFSPTALTGLSVTAGANVANSITSRVLSSAAASYCTPLLGSIQDRFATAQTFVMYTIGATTAGGFDGANTINEAYATPSNL